MRNQQLCLPLLPLVLAGLKLLQLLQPARRGPWKGKMLLGHKRKEQEGVALLKEMFCLSLFEETDDKNVVLCKINPACKAMIRRPDGSTSGMMSHLTSKHPVDYQIYLKKSTEAIKEKVIVNVPVICLLYTSDAADE